MASRFVGPEVSPDHSSQRDSVMGDGAVCGVSAMDTSLKMGAMTSAVSVWSGRWHARGVAATAARMPSYAPLPK